MLAILFALREELKPLLREFKSESKLEVRPATIWKGHWKNFPLVLVQTGIGMEQTRHATQRLLEYFQPHHVLSVGYAGGLQPGLRVGSIVIVREVSNELNHSRTLDSQGNGHLLTVQKPLMSIAEKQAAGQRGFTVVDMETYAEVELLQERNIPCSALRVVFDTLEEPLGFEDPSLIKSLWKDPKLLCKIPKAIQMNRLCQERLYQALSALIPKLADQGHTKNNQ